jgi:hypothetical protein
MKSKNKKQSTKDLEARRKGSRFFDMVDKAPYNNSKKGEIKIFKTSSRQMTETSSTPQKKESQAKVDIEQARKENPFLQLFEGISSTKAKRGQTFTAKFSHRNAETTKNPLNKKQLPLENIKHISWVDGKVNVIYKDGNKLTSNADEIELVSDYQNENDIPLNDHCL